MAPSRDLDELRQHLSRLDAGHRDAGGSLPFGLSVLDRSLPRHGLARGALHEFAGGGQGAIDAAAPTLFAAGIAARLEGPILWCLNRADLFAPALAQAGLSPSRVTYVETPDEPALMAAFEEGLRHPALAGVVAEVGRLSMTASRRLQLAAETSGVTALAVRRWRKPADAADFGQPTAATTRWRITPLPSTPLPVRGVGRPRWWVELIRSRGGGCLDVVLEACDEKGRLALPAPVVDRPLEASPGRYRTAA